jgi:hypothetical protein
MEVEYLATWDHPHRLTFSKGGEMFAAGVC